MSRSPSIIPDHTDREICIVLDDFRSAGTGLARETNDAQADSERLIRDLLDGRYRRNTSKLADFLRGETPF